jgi:spermidine/putrescine transport system permease protein
MGVVSLESGRVSDVARGPHRTWWRRGMTRRPYFLEGFTWAYLAWSLLPICIAVMFSFNAGKSNSTWQGFSLRWYLTDPNDSVLHSAELHTAVIQTLRLGLLTTVIAVPLGVAFAIGIDRWHGRIPNGLSFLMILSFVVPELLLAVALMFVFTQLFTVVHFGTGAEVLGLVVWNLSWPAIIVRARCRSRRLAALRDLQSAGAAANAGDLRERRARVRLGDR